MLMTIVTAAALATLATMAPAEEAEKLQINKDQMALMVETEDGPVEITREMTSCALNKGWLQPLVPVEGVRPVAEIEVLDALVSGDALVVDMRTIEWRVKSTIPGSIHIPYTEVADRLDELGCEKGEDGTWDCAGAKSFIGFCNGPVCPQSPMAMKAAVREGFPAEKIGYYRGGMLDWHALGLSTVEGIF